MTAIFIEPSLLEKDEIQSALDGTGFPTITLESFGDVQRAQSTMIDAHGERIADMFWLFVFSDFETDLFKTVKRKLKSRNPKITIIGPPYLHELAANKENGFQFTTGRHIFNNVFKNQAVVIGGKPKSDYDSAIVNSKYLGALVKNEISTKVRYLFTTNLKSTKFNNATKFDIPVIKRDLIFDLWKERSRVDLSLTTELIQQYRYRTFDQLQLRFLGFDADQTSQLEMELIRNGGEVERDRSNADSTYILVPNDYPKPEKMTFDELENVVMEEWFWSSIQIGYRVAITQYRPKWYDRMHETVYENTELSFAELTSMQSPGRGMNSMNTSADKNAIRHHILLDFAKRCGITDAEIEGHQHPQGTPDKKARKRSLVATVKEGFTKAEPKPPPNTDEDKIRKNREARKMVAQELYDTERNYVKLLGYVIEEYKEKLDTSGLISETECRQIFGNLPDLRALHTELEQEMSNTIQAWSSDTRLGELIASYCSKFLAHYPPYINYLDRSLLLIKEFQESRPKFKAFLRSVLCRTTYSRQDLSDLLSLPVQRLPRYGLLLAELKKKTAGMDPTHPDIEHLESAILQIKKVNNEVNSAKGQTDNHYNMFEIFNEIIDCPHNIISAQRKYIFRFNCTVADNSKELGTKMGEKLCIIFFNDMFVLCRRKRTLNKNKKSASRTPVKRTNSGRNDEKECALHFKSNYSNSNLIKIINVNETPDCQRCFAFMIQIKNNAIALLTVQVKVDSDKTEYISTVADLITKLKYADKAFTDELVTKVDHNQLNITTKELHEAHIKRLAKSGIRKLTKFSSRLNLGDGDMSRVDCSPVKLTQDQRYDSEASLTSIDSVMSMATMSNISNFVTPQKKKIPKSPSVGFKSVRGLFSGKSKTRTNSNAYDFSHMRSENPTSLPPTSLPPTFKKTE